MPNGNGSPPPQLAPVQVGLDPGTQGDVLRIASVLGVHPGVILNDCVQFAMAAGNAERIRQKIALGMMILRGEAPPLARNEPPPGPPNRPPDPEDLDKRTPEQFLKDLQEEAFGKKADEKPAAEEKKPDEVPS